MKYLSNDEKGIRNIANHIGLSIPRTRAIASEMINEGLIDTEGQNKNRKYKINKG